jgi:CheY-like chemotaxis protein
MQNIPAFFYSSTIAWIDDDELFLDAASHLFPFSKLKTFTHPSDCLDFFSVYRVPYQPLLRGKLDDDSYETLDHSPVDLNVTSLPEISSISNRHNEITIIIVDYKLPEMTGLELCKELQSNSAKKILLTGEANHDKAVSAFNDNIIDRFIRKDSPSIINEIKSYVMDLQQQYFNEKTHGLISHLEAENPIPSTDPIFRKFFQDICRQNFIKEYYLLDKNGSYMLIDENNQKKLLIIHTDRTLDSFIQLNDDTNNIEEILKSIKERENIPFFGVNKDSWQIESNEWKEHFYTPKTFNGRERYFWILINHV